MSLSSKKIVLASLNLGKLREFNYLLAPLNITLIAQQELQIPAAPEPYMTFVENALAKARQASTISQLPSLADDSGICVEALHGAPGIHSARFAGPQASDAQNNAYLLEILKNEPNRRAKYVCALVYLRYPADPEPIIASGVWHGEIIDTPLGSHGFGYDPYFFIPEYQQTAAELEPSVRHQVSHRARATQNLIEQLRHE